ncbi:MAG: hypothetical protein HXX16_05020 [Bacteroidales bacterium]|nr:hypothetical protein [Bacteroidales bacterium]
MRIVFLSKGHKRVVPILVIHLDYSLSQIMSNLNKFAYAAGFGIGNYASLLVVARMAVGDLMILKIKY